MAKANLIQVKPPTAQMITLSKTLEVLDPSECIVHGKTVKQISEQELNLVVITLAANCISYHKKRPAGTISREIATSLQYIPKADMLIGGFDEKSREVLLLMVKGTLTQSLADDDICPALTLGLYSAEELNTATAITRG